MNDEIEAGVPRVLCIGRALVDVPQSMVVSYGGTYFSGWKVVSKLETVESFNARLQARVDELAITRNEKGQRSLERERVMENGWVGRMLQFNRRSLRSVLNGVVAYEDVVSIEGFIHADGVSFDISSDINSEVRYQELELLIRRFMVRRGDEIPVEWGYCIEHGFISGGENSSLSEGITIFLGFPNYEDIAMILDLTAGTKAPDTLLERVAGIEVRRVYASRFKNIRIGPRKINEHEGEEVLSRVTEQDGRSNHTFYWESIPIKEDIFHPQITMELSTGHHSSIGRRRTPFTDGEAVALWDQITKTLRNRPGR